MPEWIVGKSVVVDRVQADHGRDGGQCSNEENADEGDLLARRPINADKGFDREGKDEDICKNVETRRDWLSD